MDRTVVETIRLSLLERAGVCLRDAIDEHFKDLSDAVRVGDVRLLLRTITQIHSVATESGGYQYAETICCRLERLIRLNTSPKAPLLDKRIFFVWIGLIGVRELKHLLVWRRANPHYQVALWIDSDCLLAGKYVDILRADKAVHSGDNSELIKLQNRRYRKLLPLMTAGLAFDEALISVFLDEDTRVGLQLRSGLDEARRFYRHLQLYLAVNDIRHGDNVFAGDEFSHFYIREIALRGNLASASDILRLNILYRFGGVYIDCDTLPSLDHVFVRTEAYCRERHITCTYIDVVKAELYLRKIDPLIRIPELGEESQEKCEARRLEIDRLIEEVRARYGGVVDLIKDEIETITAESAFRALREIAVYQNLLLLSADKFFENCFNNNVLIANPKSKIVKIILREMRRRYRYLANMGAIDIETASDISQDSSYLARLLNYRFDALDAKDNVTVILTGPGLIFEVLMGVGFSILKLDARIAPLSLSHTLYSSTLGISFFDQLLYTYDHTKSCWMKPSEALVRSSVRERVVTKY